MSSQPTATSHGNGADAAIERIAALPPLERRAAFFQELDALPLHSRERADLLALGRGRFAPGPYVPREFEAIAGITYPRRTYSEEELRAQAEHAAALEALRIARAAWEDAYFERRAAQNAYDSGRSPLSDKKASEADRVALIHAREAEEVAAADLRAAELFEVRARLHQRRPLPPPPPAPAGVLSRLLKAVRP